MIEASARKVKQGPQVREGLLIEQVLFRYDVERYGEELDKLALATQFTVPAVVNGRRIRRTRAKFDCPWSVVGVAGVDEELVDQAQLTGWLALGGRRVGLGDWRPENFLACVLQHVFADALRGAPRLLGHPGCRVPVLVLASVLRQVFQLDVVSGCCDLLAVLFGVVPQDVQIVAVRDLAPLRDGQSFERLLH